MHQYLHRKAAKKCILEDNIVFYFCIIDDNWSSIHFAAQTDCKYLNIS